MCRSCGAIVGAGEEKCAVCGAATSSQGTPKPRRLSADRETIRFARAVLNRPFKFTIVILIANLFVFLLMWHSSGMTMHALSEFPEPVLLAYGAKLNSLIKYDHQWWRFITPMFVHVNLVHVLVNMYSLWVVGPYVEKLYGSAKFVVFWVLTGVAGVVASYLTVVDSGAPIGSVARFLLKTRDAPSAGASGALFGLVGVLFVFGIKFRHELPEGFKRAFGTGLIPMILLNLFIGYIGRGLIDNAAHLGGLVAGAALAVVVGYRRPGEKTGIAFTWQALQYLAIGIVAVSFLLVVQHFPPLAVLAAAQTGQNSTANGVSDFVVFAHAMNNGQEAFYGVIQEGNTNIVDDAVRNLDSAPHLDPTSDELKETLKALLLEARKLRITSSAAEQKSLLQQPDLVRAFVSWSRRYNQWLKTSGKRYSGLNDVTAPSPPAN